MMLINCSFTAFGAPQSHYQRSSSYDGLTIQGWQEVKKYMKGKSAYRYNPSYGFGKKRCSVNLPTIMSITNLRFH